MIYLFVRPQITCNIYTLIIHAVHNESLMELLPLFNITYSFLGCETCIYLPGEWDLYTGFRIANVPLPKVTGDQPTLPTQLHTHSSTKTALDASQLKDMGHMGVSKNRGTPKSSHFNRVFHEKKHPFWGTTIFGNTQICFFNF